MTVLLFFSWGFDKFQLFLCLSCIFAVRDQFFIHVLDLQSDLQGEMGAI